MKTILRESGVQTALRAFEQALTESALESPELRDREIMLDLAKHMMRAQSLID